MRLLYRFIVAATVVLLPIGCAGHFLYSSGPFRGKVIDAETGQPLVGAVVLAIWYREVPVAPHGPATDYHDALEVLTDAQGEFRVPTRTHVTWIGRIREPVFVIYYPGYGYYPTYQVRPRAQEIAEAYEQREFTIELPRLTTQQDRILCAGLPIGVFGKIPTAHIPNLIRLVNAEREQLGLKPIGRLEKTK